ncbi:cytochrome C biogenesis protein ResB [Nakamurella sp. YIM 132087]|uniref:Cytochrome C biogenesis protein ResB n=2 Tax=Nakamurella alba TaxID=2665158 RepID=A0A7K1FK32_9ACTN|nr:cytochrome C biogenesis protein ResB [Nakamurella alba]
MRTALVLLFLLALASLPGALLPQWSLNQSKTANYILDNGWWGRFLNSLGFFDVFASPWYAAIYLLLFTSLVGCLLPRSWEFVGQLRMQPVVVPRNLRRMPLHETLTATGDPDAVADRVLSGLRGWRIARRTEADGVVTISAEKGFLREVGNLVFHLSMLGLLVAIAVGKLVGYEGSIILTAAGGTQTNERTVATAAGSEGSGFCSVDPYSYDNFRPGLLVDGTGMSPFCVQVDSFTATYTDAGQASSFLAQIRYQTDPAADGDTWQSATLEVNDPIRLDGQRLYLLGHGYTPIFEVTYPDGSTQTGMASFQPEDSNFTSQGAVKFLDPPGVTGAELLTKQLAVVGIFAPSAFVHTGVMTSSFPAAEQPAVAVRVFVGDLGMESGATQSIFSIDQDQVDKGLLVQKASENLAPGESLTLDDGTQVTFTGYREWVSLQTSYDPAQTWALVCAALLLIGLMLSLTIKRRRVWFRIRPAAGPSSDGGAGSSTVMSGVEVGGLSRTDQAGYGEEFSSLVALATVESTGSRRSQKE